MPTKTDRILGYLPFTFRPATRQSALRAVVDAIGSELQKGENTLAAIMRSHWVDTADKGAERIDDLARIGALYGLAPQRESEALETDGAPPEDAGPARDLETVEEFRIHLKRYVRTLLDGTVTVEGILRVAAETLAVTIPEGLAAAAPWWRASTDATPMFEARGEDAAAALLGLPALEARGRDALPARVVGSVDLGAGLDLTSAHVLRLQVDETGPFDVDLAAGSPDPTRVPLEHMIGRINQAFAFPVASREGAVLVLTSPTTGPTSRIELEDSLNDASTIVLGVAPRVYIGADAHAAELRSAVDLSGGVDLSARRYLRLVVDGQRIVEVDCANPGNPAVTVLEDIRNAVNQAQSGPPVVTDDPRVLVLRSPTTGTGGSLMIQPAAAQDCAAIILKTPSTFALGAEARPAAVTSVKDLSGGVDLSESSVLRVRIDEEPAVDVSCAGRDPSHTTLGEIVDRLTAILGPGVATTDGRRLELRSRGTGHRATFAFERAAAGDALERILGFGPRVFTGAAALPASLEGTVDLSAGLSLWAQYRLGLSIDGGDPIEVDLRSTAGEDRIALPQELARAINGAVGRDVAFSDGQRLQITSTEVGAASAIRILPLERVRATRFVTRAPILEDAARLVLGFVSVRATGEAATTARLVGTPDLGFGVDLRRDGFLALSLDARPTVLIDCAGARPHATVPAEITAALRVKLSEALGKSADQEPLLASDDGKHLVLFSPSQGSASRIEFRPVRALDALPVLLGVEPGERQGQDAAGIVFTGTVDLTSGVELPADARLRITLDVGAPTEVPLNPTPGPSRRFLGELAAAINAALNAAVAFHDGRLLSIRSPSTGDGARLVLDPPTAGTDATPLVFGIRTPRAYQGANATSAQVIGQKTHVDPIDLSRARFLRVSVDGGPSKDIDCAAGAPRPQSVELTQVVAAINGAVNGLAREIEGRLVLRSGRGLGVASRLTLLPFIAGDAREKLFGPGPALIQGVDPRPAVLVGTVDFSRPIDLSRYHHLLLSIDGARAVEIDIQGSEPTQTSLDDVVEAINRRLPGVASATPARHLRLESVTRGAQSTIEVLPRRHLDLIEFPAGEATKDVGGVRHGDVFRVTNAGAAATSARIRIQAPHGVAGLALVNASAGRRIGLRAVVGAGEAAIVETAADGVGVAAYIVAPDGTRQRVPDDAIEIELIEAGQATIHPLRLPRGESSWMYLECQAPRYDESRFNDARFPGAECAQFGIFDVSRFQNGAGGESTEYTPDPPLPGPTAFVMISWDNHRLGAFDLNLPAELAPRFGGSFDESRFGLEKGKREYSGVVFGPGGDPDFLGTRVAQDRVIEANVFLGAIPPGFAGHRVPFRKPRRLQMDQRIETPDELGVPGPTAVIYVVEPGSDTILQLKATRPGTWATEIAVSLRPDGPGRYLLTLYFEGARFENARQMVLGEPYGATPATLAGAGAAGVLQAKAAGVRARVTRDRAADDAVPRS